MDGGKPEEINIYSFKNVNNFRNKSIKNMILKDISLKKFSPFLPLHMISYTFDCYLWTEKFSQ